MKIAIIHQPFNLFSIENLHDSIGIWIYEITRYLSKTCDVIVYSRKGLFKKHPKHFDGVKCIYIRSYLDDIIKIVLKKIYRLLYKDAKHPYYSSFLYYFTYVLKISINLRVNKCNVIYIHNFSQFIPIIRAFNPKIIIILHMHCEWLTILDHDMIEKRLKNTDLIIGCCDYITEKIRSRFPEFASRCFTIYNGVDTKKFTRINKMVRSNKNKVLLFVGRISPEKGLHTLLDAFQRVLDRYSCVRLKIIGPKNPMPPEFIVEISDNPKILFLKKFYFENYPSTIMKRLTYNMKKKVYFTDIIPYKYIFKQYQGADIFVNSSFSEAFPLPILEAMACGLPVIASNVGGIPEIIEDQKTGILVESGDSNALTNAIINLLNDDNLIKVLKDEAHKLVIESFSWKHISENLLNICKNISNINE